MRLTALFTILLVGWAPAALGQAVVPGAYRLLHAEAPNARLAGEVLISELGCANCHALPEGFAHSEYLPAKKGPNLDGLSERTNADYVRAFLIGPEDVKPGTTMPAHVLRGIDADAAEETVDALTHFLFSLDGENSLQDDADVDSGAVEEGDRLFHSVGCVACHEPLREPSEESGGDPFFDDGGLVEYPDPEIPSVPLSDLHRKTTASALAAFLLDPSTTRPSGRMPDLKLTDNEARAIASYLIGNTGEAGQEQAEFDLDSAKVEQGAKDFVRFGCVQCHDVSSDTRAAITLQAPSLGPESDFSKGCHVNAAAAPAPGYELDEEQRNAIETALRDSGEQGDRIQFTVAAFNCLACHKRDGYGGIEAGRDPYFKVTVDADLGDEGRIPPTLTGVGAKLTKDWLVALFTGEGEARPYMAARMPHFDIADPEELAEAMMEADADPDAPETDVTGLLHHHRNHYGRELMGTEALSCISCHDLNGHRSTGIPAIDLALATERLQPEWFKKYLLDPASLRPGTRMPAFFPEGKSTYPGLFKGNANQQIEALWIYLREIDQTRLPEGMEESDRYVLEPEDRPLVLRTFMQDVGARAIAIGYPEKVNVAFDAGRVRFVEAWTGAFIDANSTWNDRFSPYAEALGDVIWEFPDAAPLAAETGETWPGDGADYAFCGYRYNDAGRPVMLYEYQGLPCTEEFVPHEDGRGFRRIVTVRGASVPLYFLAAEGKVVEEGDAYELPGKWRCEVRDGARNVLVRADSAANELVFEAVPVDGITTIVQDVTW